MIAPSSTWATSRPDQLAGVNTVLRATLADEHTRTLAACIAPSTRPPATGGE